MPSCGAALYSADTRTKHEHVGGLFRMHATIVNGIIGRWQASQFVYVDLNSGPGEYDHGAIGSPCLAVGAFASYHWCAGLHCFERDADTYERLAKALSGHAKAIAYHEDHREGLDRVLSSYAPSVNGLIFSDPNPGIENVPIDVLTRVAARYPRVDFLLNISATTVKRVRRSHIGGLKLSEQLAHIGKPYGRVRRPVGAQQWTLVLLTSWKHYPEWKREGFVRFESEEGRDVLDRLDLTAKESQDAHEGRLF